MFGDSDKLRDLYLRYGRTKLSEDLAAFDLGITRAGALWISCWGRSNSPSSKQRKSHPGGWDSMRPGDCVR